MTSRTQEEDIVTGSQAGADDYMCKPFKTNELLARIQALLRRANPISQSSDAFDFGHYHIDTVAATMSLRCVPVELAPKEYEFVLLLFSNPCCLISRDV